MLRVHEKAYSRDDSSHAERSVQKVGPDGIELGGIDCATSCVRRGSERKSGVVRIDIAGSHLHVVAVPMVRGPCLGAEVGQRRVVVGSEIGVDAFTLEDRTILSSEDVH